MNGAKLKIVSFVLCCTWIKNVFHRLYSQATQSVCVEFTNIKSPRILFVRNKYKIN